MTWQLVRRDPAWQFMRALMVFVPAMCVVCHFVFTGAGRHGISAQAVLFQLIFLPNAFAAPTAVVMQSQETRLFAILPVTVRQVFRARMISVLTMIWLPVIAAMIAQLAFRGWFVFDLPLAHWVAFTFGVLAFQCAAIHGVALSRGWLFLLTVFPFFGNEARWLLPDNSRVPSYVAIVCCVIGVAIVLRTWQILPVSFQDVVHPTRPAAGRLARRASRNSSLRAWVPVWRTISMQSGVQLVFLFVLMLSSRFFFTYFYLITGWQTARHGIGWLKALPVPARSLLAAIVLPPILALTAGYFISLHIPSFPYSERRGITVRDGQALPGFSTFRTTLPCGKMNVLPPLEFWVPVRAGRAPLIRLPWGETFQPSTFRVSGFDIYNPYAVGCVNSRSFLEWQFRRATIAIYGQPIELDTSNGFYSVEAHVVGTSARTQVVGCSVPVLVLLLSLLVLMIFDWYRFRALAKRKQVAAMLLVIAGTLGISNLNLVQWVSWTLPASLTGTVCIVLGAIALCCWMLDRLFPQLEFIDKAGAGVRA